MEQNVTLARNELFSAMDNDKPKATYIKTILGKVAVTVWDNFIDKPVEVILQGNPKSKDKTCIVSVYSEREKAFFERTNLRLFKKGLLVPVTLPEAPVAENTIEQATDDELKAIVNLKWLALVNKLNKINSVPVLFRMITIAEDLEKSSKITDAIKARISEIQASEYVAKEVSSEDEE